MTFRRRQDVFWTSYVRSIRPCVYGVISSFKSSKWSRDHMLLTYFTSTSSPARVALTLIWWRARASFSTFWCAYGWKRTSKTSLLNIPHVDYGDVIYDQAYNKSFHEKLENFQCNASLAMTGAIRGTSKEKLYQELGFESLQHRRWFHKLYAFYKIFKNQSLRYLYELLLIKTTPRNTTSSINLPFFYIKHNFFKNSFFPSAVIEWNNLD